MGGILKLLKPSPFKPAVTISSDCRRCKYFVPNPMCGLTDAVKYGLCSRGGREKSNNFEYAQQVYDEFCRGWLFETKKESLPEMK